MTKYSAVLNSRQNLWPTGKTEWIEQTRQAVLRAGENNYTLLTSIGMQTWETQVAFCSLNKISQKIIIPLREDESFDEACQKLTTAYDLENKLVEFVALASGNSHLDIRQQRDEVIVKQADLLLPVSIRSSGNLIKLISEAEQRGQTIDNRFNCDYDQTSTGQSYTIDTKELNTDVLRTYRDYLIHWTRTSNRAWPDERAIDYYRDVFDSTVYPRSAFDTLVRIVKTGKIIASSRHMPGSIATVSFSALSPEEVVPLMRWRARYHQMTFEPYGIGVKQGAAEKAGFMPVYYYNKSGGVPGRVPVWLTQSSGIKTDWRTEREYRSRGDFCLDKIPPDRFIIFTRYKQEAEKLSAKTGLKAVPMLR